MKQYLLQILIFLPFVSRSQDSTGVTFNQNSTWSEIQAQAKSQNKFILVDCYATWYGPCKWMDKNIFPLKEAGDSVNSYFVSVRIQMDTTKADNERIKSWYPVAHQLYEQYSIDAFPTLLFFSPEGELVHRFVGASPTVADFIGLTKNARDPASQYYTMIKKYEGGYRDSIFLENLGNAAYNFASPE